MKRATVLLLLFFYSCAVSGATLHLHFCGAHLQEISFEGFEHKNCCCKKKMQSQKNCCTNKIVVIKVDGQQKQAATTVVSEKTERSLTAVLYSQPLHSFADRRIALPVSHPPPLVLHEKEALFLLHGVFRI